PTGDFLGYVERLLLDHGFTHIISGEGDAQVHIILDFSDLRDHNKLLMLRSSAPTIPYDKIDSYANRGLFITTTIPLKHLHARDCMTSLQVYFQDAAWGSIRPLEATNSLLISGFAPNVWQISKIIQNSDLPPSDFVPDALVHRIAALEEKVALLEKKIEQTSKCSDS
ncbi:MAG: hypothetical protein ABIK28_21955, partial [Planctomycetota bacterium]